MIVKEDELIKDDDTNPKFIDFYLERIQANHKELFIEKLVSLFPMMPKIHRMQPERKLSVAQ